MSLAVGATVTVAIEKPVAGGRMLARHNGQVVLVDAAIPGERVQARVERVSKGLAFARTIDVLEASPDRRDPGMERSCGGSLFAHIAYPRQLALKGEILRDAFGRLGHIPLAEPPSVTASPEQGYRMRARLHARGGRLGFFHEGTHDLCDVAQTGQLLPQTNAWIAAATDVLRQRHLTGLAALDLAENLAGDERVCHLELHDGVDPAAFLPLADGLQGLSAQIATRPDEVHLAGSACVGDVLHARAGDPASAFRLQRHVRAFFQANRYLIEPLVRHVLSLVPPGPVVDLYAGVGLFGLSLAAAGAADVTLVEGDPVSGADLKTNAEPFQPRIRVEQGSVEAFVDSSVAARWQGAQALSVIVDPPRTGLSRAALAGLLRLASSRIVYVSCDAATLARDARGLLDGGYELAGVTGFDMFPNTAHVEAIAAFDMTRARHENLSHEATKITKDLSGTD